MIILYMVSIKSLSHLSKCHFKGILSLKVIVYAYIKQGCYTAKKYTLLLANEKNLSHFILF